MTRKNKIILGVLIALAVVAGLYAINRFWIAPAGTRQSLADGDHPKAPQFSLTDIFGHKLSLSEYRGKVVLLDFWATWCGPCRMEIPGFVKLQARYGSQGFQVIGISMDDDVQPVLAFYKQFDLNYRVAMGNERLGELYGGIIGLPTTFLIGRDGRIYDKVPGAVDDDRFATEIKMLLATPASTEAVNFTPDGASGSIQVETPAAVNSQVPGIDVSKLSPTEVAEYKKILSEETCTCGCNRSVLLCRETDPDCEVSRDLAQKALAKFEKDHAKI